MVAENDASAARVPVAVDRDGRMTSSDVKKDKFLSVPSRQGPGSLARHETDGRGHFSGDAHPDHIVGEKRKRRLKSDYKEVKKEAKTEYRQAKESATRLYERSLEKAKEEYEVNAELSRERYRLAKLSAREDYERCVSMARGEYEFTVDIAREQFKGDDV